MLHIGLCGVPLRTPVGTVVDYVVNQDRLPRRNTSYGFMVG